MDLSLQSIKTNHWSADNLKKHVTSMNDTGQWIPYSCQSTITWMSIRMSTTKLNTDCIYLGHLASNASKASNT